MAFEPLNTDEKVVGPKSRVRDMDSQMLLGCSGFLVAALGGYVLAIWPFFVFADTGKLRMLAISCAAGLLPAAILAALASRRFGLAGACGSVGGAMAASMFLYLRLDQIFLAWIIRQRTEPEYPVLMKALIPIAWILVILLIGMAATPKESDNSL